MSRSLWSSVLTKELTKSPGKITPINVAVTLRSSVRFAGLVTDVSSEHILKISRTVDSVRKTTYIDLDEVAAIEVL